MDQRAFLETIGLEHFKVEAYMTHDAHLFFETKEECERASSLLKSAEILGQKLFFIEAYPEEMKKLFYRIAFTDEVPSDISFKIGDKTFRFFDLFQAIVRRTGKHIPYGTLFCNQPLFPKTIKNHEIYEHLFKIAKKESPSGSSRDKEVSRREDSVR
ncbi:MAG: hypothetical protein FJZ64_04230 [Chlamydiae bacterium]|nr:hypothetical protein [Chlamydiota bacterium]